MSDNNNSSPPPQPPPSEVGRKRRRWDQVKPEPKSEWDVEDTKPVIGAATPSSGTYDAWKTPAPGIVGAGGFATPAQPPTKRNRWDQTPVGMATPAVGMGMGMGMGMMMMMTPTGPGAGSTRSRWDETPVSVAGSAYGATPAGPAGMLGATPVGPAGMFGATPAAGLMTPDQYGAMRHEMELDERNKELTDAELDEMLPSEGYTIMEPPASYALEQQQRRQQQQQQQQQQQTPIGLATPAGGFVMHEDGGMAAAAAVAENYGMIEMPEDLPAIRAEDRGLFESIMHEEDETQLDAETQRERKVLKLLLKVKNGTPLMRKQALRVLTERAREFGPKALFDQILPLLMSPTLEDQERHLLVKVIDRVLYKLDELVRPFVHNILVVVEPLLIDSDYFARVEGREIISNLAKAAGLATMIASMRPDIDSPNEYVRNTTARAFSVVAGALGIPAILPFLKAVCRSKRSWQARHTGAKIVQQMGISMGCAVLPHLPALVDVVAGGLADDEKKVRTISALAVSALAEAAAPYGYESFEPVLGRLWDGIANHNSKTLAAFLKAAGYVIPLMDAEKAAAAMPRIAKVLVREYASPDDEMRRIVLKVVKQTVATDGVTPEYVRTELLPPFFPAFWDTRMASDRKNARQLVETTIELARKVGAPAVLAPIAVHLKDPNPAFRCVTMEAVDAVVTLAGTGDIDTALENALFDGAFEALQLQASDAAAAAAAAAAANGSDATTTVINGLGSLVNAFGIRAKPYLSQIAGSVRWQLNNKSAAVRQQAADLTARIAGAMHACNEEGLLASIAQILYECLGEEYPDVLGSILGALKAVVNVVGMGRMTPPIKDLLPRLTPILKNRNEKVEENVIDLVGRIADRGAEYVSSREWMRICFELLDMLRAPKKAIRRATVNTFGYIAKAIGPSDVLVTLLNNLKVQERQLRVCTSVAIAVVAETCSPFTVLPGLMNEYRLPEKNVQNGVLKALSFIFEYIGEMGKDYVYAVTPLLEDALINKDPIHRQTACSVVKHIGLGVPGLGCEDALMHLMDFVWPNVFETLLHLPLFFSDAVDGVRLSVGPASVLLYLLPGLFHPARKVRNVYWKLYNNLYIASEDALVAFYPRVEDEHNNHYLRSELDLFI